MPSSPHRRRTDYMLALVALALAFGALAVVLSGRFSQSATTAHTDAVTVLRIAIRHQCVASNVQTAQNNSSHAADYAADQADSALYEFVLGFGPNKHETRAQRKAAREFAGKLRASRSKLAAAAAAKTWSPLTNCTAPLSQAGQIELFSIGQKRLPWYAQGSTPAQLKNAAQPDPVGSIH